MKRTTVLVAVLLAMTMQSGCLWAPDLDRVRIDIERQLPGTHFEKEFALSLGPLTLGVVKMVTAIIPSAREARSYLRDVSQVRVAVYKADRVPDTSDLRMPVRLANLVDKDDWEIAVRVKEEKQDTVWILYRADDEKIKELYVVALNEEELVMVRASGNIEQLAARAMREHHRGGEFRVDNFF